MQIVKLPCPHRALFRNKRLPTKIIKKVVKTETWLLHGSKRDSLSPLGWQSKKFSYPRQID